MTHTEDPEGPERDIEALKAKLEQYRAGNAQLDSKALADLARAIHELSDHLLKLHRRMARIEQTHDAWSTRDWEVKD